jgi:hypothetical protein
LPAALIRPTMITPAQRNLDSKVSVVNGIGDNVLGLGSGCCDIKLMGNAQIVCGPVSFIAMVLPINGSPATTAVQQ